MPSPSTATAAARPCAPLRLAPASCSLPSRALVKFAPASLLAHRPRPSLAVARAASPDATTGARSPASGGQMLVFVPPHPLIKHWVSVLRNEQTPCAVFRSAMAELGRLLVYEASRDWLPTITGEVQTPVAVSSVEFIDPRESVMVVPILRAGLALAENVSSVLPATKTYHLGRNYDKAKLREFSTFRSFFCQLYQNYTHLETYAPLFLSGCLIEHEGLRRDEETLQPSIYLNNLPDKIPEGTRVLVIDPMLATGGTIVAAIDLLIERGVTSKQIKVISAVAAPPALTKLSNKFPGLHVYSGMIDSEVDEKGYIVPGLGDAGDRSFAT